MTRVCLVPALGAISYPEVDANDPNAMHDLLGGYLEPIQLPPYLGQQGLMGLVDEDGLRKNLPHNVYSVLLGQPLVGPVIIVRTDPPDTVDLTDEDVAALDEYFGHTFVVVL